MELIFFVFIVVSLLLSLCTHNSHCQFPYVGMEQSNCSSTASALKGYICTEPQQRCQSFVTFRSAPPYDSPISIASLLGSDSSDVASINNFQSTTETIPTDNLVVVPASCYCSGSIFLHQASYTVVPNDTYSTLTSHTFQGLTSCQAIIDQNYYIPENIPVGTKLLVPVRCACPSANQMANGITALLTYIVKLGDSTDSIGAMFNVSGQSIRQANMLQDGEEIYASTPILVPLGREVCEKNPKSFFCYCPNGYVVDGTGGQGSLKCIQGRKKFPFKLVLVIGACIAVGCSCLCLLSYWQYKNVKKRRKRIVKEKLFKQNGGSLLQQKFSSYGINDRAKLFSEEEMVRATDNYNNSRFLGQGGFGMIYKGMLPDGSIVAVKKSKTIDRGQIEQFINEVVVLSQINHRNIVKLIGCCLETELPLLVYEYIPNGTLSHHIHQQEKDCFLSWDDRFRIACEVAGAVAYMHSATSIPIFHRDIKPSNILLDDKYTAKVSDFGTSKPNPHDKTHLTTAVQGTFGYMDPEYLQSSQFTDRSDVYSFGVVLVELLTSQKPTSFSEENEGRHLVARFIRLTKEGRVSDVLDPVVAGEAKTEVVLAVAKLALRCLRLNGKSRPTMREVALELEGLQKSQSSSNSIQMSDLFEEGLLDEGDEADEQ